MNDINAELKQSLKILDSLIPQIDDAINSMSEKLDKLADWLLRWIPYR